jgi:hypothetical protein
MCRKVYTATWNSVLNWRQRTTTHHSGWREVIPAGGSTTPIVFECGTALEIKAKKDSVTIGEGATYAGTTTLSLAVLTVGITEADLKAASQSGGKIIISANSNAGLYNKMLLNLETCGIIDFH